MTLKNTIAQSNQSVKLGENFGRRFLHAAKSVRVDKLRYMLIFSLAPIFPNLKNNLISDGDQILGLNATFAMGIAYSLGIGLVFLLSQPVRLHQVARILSVVTALLFLGWLVSSPSLATPWLGLFFSLGLGGCAGLAMFGFTYALNDTERLFGAAASVLFSMTSQMILSRPSLQHLSGMLYLGAQVLVTLLCLTRFDPRDYLDSLSIAKTGGIKNLAVALFLFLCAPGHCLFLQLSSSRVPLVSCRVGGHRCVHCKFVCFLLSNLISGTCATFFCRHDHQLSCPSVFPK